MNIRERERDEQECTRVLEEVDIGEREMRAQECTRVLFTDRVALLQGGVGTDQRRVRFSKQQLGPPACEVPIRC